MRIARVISPIVAPAATASTHASNKSGALGFHDLASLSQHDSLSSSSIEVRCEEICCTRRLWNALASTAGASSGFSSGWRIG